MKKAEANVSAFLVALNHLVTHKYNSEHNEAAWVWGNSKPII